MADRTNHVAELKRWCRGEGLEEEKALLVVVPEDVDIATIEETVGTIKCFGRVRVRGRIFNTALSSLTVLCECREKFSQGDVPKEVVNMESELSWQIITVGDAAPLDDFRVKLQTLLAAEGKTLEDIKGLLPNAAPQSTYPESPANPTESILLAVGDLLEKTCKPTTEGGYRRLRLFSGNLPIPPSEEAFDHWLEQAWLMVEESECSDREKKRRLIESLKGPALEIAKSVRDSDPEACPSEYLNALEGAFGSAESGDDLYFSFRLMQQLPGEKLSDFLRRLERALIKVVQRGGFPTSSKDTARLEQLLRGATASDLMLIQLRLRERKSSPPTFLQLLSEIRTEEEYEASRRRLRSSVQPVRTKHVGAESHAELQSLKDEVKELKTKLACMSLSPAAKETRRSASPVSTTQSSEHSDTYELAALKKQVKRLQHKVEQKDDAPELSEKPARVKKVDVSPKTSTPNRNRQPLDEQFCYRCGEQGHYAAKCHNPDVHRLQASQQQNSARPIHYSLH
ncbi:unnamed protein product [Knipowitschia caucasica]